MESKDDDADHEKNAMVHRRVILRLDFIFLPIAFTFVIQ